MAKKFEWIQIESMTRLEFISATEYMDCESFGLVRTMSFSQATGKLETHSLVKLTIDELQGLVCALKTTTPANSGN